MAQGVAGAMENGKPHYVYLISDGIGRLKIGHSNNPRKRLSTLATGASSALCLKHQWSLSSRAQAVALEGALHNILRWAQTAREWHKVEWRHAKALGDAILLSDANLCDELSSAIRGLYQANGEAARLMTRFNVLSPRWHGSQRQEIVARADDAHGRAAAFAARTHALGVELSEGELALRRMEAKYSG